MSPIPGRATDRRDLDSLIQSLVGEGSRPGSAAPGSPAHRASRPTSVLSAGELSNSNSDLNTPADGTSQPPQTHSISVQTLSTAPLTTIYDAPPSPVKEVFTYSKGVQTSTDWTPPRHNGYRASGAGDSEDEDEQTTPSKKRLSRRDKEKEDEIRQNLRREIEEELKAAKEGSTDSTTPTKTNFPLRALTEDELNVVKQSEDLQSFVEWSTKVVERALDDEYDILADYSHNKSHDLDDEEDGDINTAGRGRRKVRQVIQFYDERWSKKRMITSIDFSPKFPELVLASYTKNPSAPHDPDGRSEERRVGKECPV